MSDPIMLKVPANTELAKELLDLREKMIKRTTYIASVMESDLLVSTEELTALRTTLQKNSNEQKEWWAKFMEHIKKSN